MKKLLLLTLSLVILAGCAYDNTYREAVYKWQERNAWKERSTGAIVGSTWTGAPALKGWDLEAHMTTKSGELGSAIIVSTLSYERIKQWRTIKKMESEVIDCLEMVNNHPFPASFEDDKKIMKWRRYMEELLQASEMASDALKYCERDDLEEAKNKVVAARAIFYR